MTYIQNHSRVSTRRRRIILWSTVAAIVIAALIEYRAPQIFSGLALAVAKPYWRTEFSVGSGALSSNAALLSRNAELERELADAHTRLSDTAATETENTELKTLLGRSSTTPYVLAAVLARPPYSGYDELVLDAGADHSFSEGNTVYASGNVPIGVITSVSDTTAIATLYSSPGEKYQVLIGPTHAVATAVGRGGGEYAAELPRDTRVAAGDFVLSSTLGDRPVGVVVSVVTDPARSFVTVLFAPNVNLYELRWVLVDPRIRL